MFQWPELLSFLDHDGFQSVSDSIPDKVDLISVPLASLGVGIAILAITQGDKWGWSSLNLILSFAIALLLVTAFVIRSNRHKAPIRP